LIVFSYFVFIELFDIIVILRAVAESKIFVLDDFPLILSNDVFVDITASNRLDIKGRMFHVQLIV